MNLENSESNISVASQQLNHELEVCIQKAAQKVKAKKENDICHYLPVPTGGYMHHFTLRKMRQEQPQALKSYIHRYILDVENPKLVLPKKRAARGSRKKSNVISLTQNDLAKVMELARKAGDEDMLAKLNPKRSLNAIKKELITSIKNNAIRQDLWESYTKQLKDQEQTKDTEKSEAVVQRVFVES